MELNTHNVPYEVTGLDKLRQRLAQVAHSQFSEVWIFRAPGWPTICALLNGEAAWLMYMRYKGDAGFSARNPKYTGPHQATNASHLCPAQCPESPAACAL